MALFSDAGVELLLRWLHFLAGITWIGLLYYFNFVQGPFFAEADGATMGAATHLPRRRVRRRNGYWVGRLVVAGRVDLKALKATTGLTTKRIEKIPGVIMTGFVVWAIVYALVRFYLVG